MNKRWWQELGCVVLIIAVSAALLFPIFEDAEGTPRRRLPPLPLPIGTPRYRITDCGEGYDGYLHRSGRVTPYSRNLIALHETGASIRQTSSGRTVTWQIQWKNQSYDLGDKWQQKLQSAHPNATGQVAIQIFNRPYLWDRGKLTPLRTSEQKGKVSGLNATDQAVGTVERRAYLWDKTGGRALFSTESSAQAINDRGDIIGEVEEPVRYGYLWQPGKLHTIGKPIYIGTIAYVEPIALNQTAVVVGNIGLVPPTDKKHANKIPWDTPFLWNAGRTEFLASIVENPQHWNLERAVAINDQGQILVSGHYPGKTYPAHLLLLTPIGEKAK